jgi:hypothetical protein
MLRAVSKMAVADKENAWHCAENADSYSNFTMN